MTLEVQVQGMVARRRRIHSCRDDKKHSNDPLSTHSFRGVYSNLLNALSSKFLLTWAGLTSTLSTHICHRVFETVEVC